MQPASATTGTVAVRSWLEEPPFSEVVPQPRMRAVAPAAYTPVSEAETYFAGVYGIAVDRVSTATSLPLVASVYFGFTQILLTLPTVPSVPFR